MTADLFQLCNDKKWPEVRKYLSSDVAEEEKKSNIMYYDDFWGTCLHRAIYCDAPDDIMKAMVAIGGKDLVMKVDFDNRTVLHFACRYGASYNIIKMLIEVGGKDLVMAKSRIGNTALHSLCGFIKTHTKATETIKLILQVGDANLLLSAKSIFGTTPLEIATDKGASNIIKKLLAVQSATNSTRSNTSLSASIVPAETSTPITQSNQDHDTTRSSCTNNDRNIPIRGLGIDQNHQSQLKEAKEKAKTIQQDYDQKCIDYSDLEEKLQKMKDKAGAPVADIQMIKKEEGEVARAQELLAESSRRAADLEATVETQRLEIADLSNEKDGIEKEYMDKVDKLTRQLSKQQTELQELKKSSSEGEVGMKRKHTNEEHEEGEGTVVVQSQTQSSKRRRAVNTRNALSGSLNTDQAGDDDAELIGMLTTRYLDTRKQLQRSNARIAQFEEEHDRKGSARI
jgi:hypothetical protein